jgi:hypothetical protein
MRHLPIYRIGSDVDPVLLEEIVKELERKPLDVNTYRKTVGRSQVFGIVRQRGHYYTGSKMNYKRPELFQKILALASQILEPDFKFCSIQVNQNYQIAPHKDKGNVGESCIIAFGNYSGGELVVEDQKVNIKNKTLYFDGSKYTHYTEPFSGNRYSLVFHTPNMKFRELPVWGFESVNGKLCLSEILYDIKRIYSKYGVIVYASDSVIPERIPRMPILRKLVEDINQY